MNTTLKLSGFAAGLAAAFAAAFVAGASADPVAPDTDRPRGGMATPGHEAEGPGTDGHGTPGGHEDGSGSAALPGLAVSDAGYTLDPAAATLPRGRRVPFAFRITGPDGEAVTAYEEKHEKELHLIVVRRDLAGFQHVHPTLAADGTWTVPLDVPSGGTYRVFADFEPTGLGRGVTLGTDLSVAGTFEPAPLPPPAATTSVDGFDVTVEGVGRVRAGQETEIAFTVSRGGREVTDLQPYLGAFGHLVSLRTGDLAYLHTHPVEDAHGDADGDAHGGPTVRFATEFPTAGTYRLFLDFQVDGVVRTAELTISAGKES